MEKTYTYYQPEYVSKFKCDGKACGAHCCKQRWQIFFDKKTYEKYSHLKPKSVADEITSHFARQEGGVYMMHIDSLLTKNINALFCEKIIYAASK